MAPITRGVPNDQMVGTKYIMHAPSLMMDFSARNKFEGRKLHIQSQ